MHGPHGPVRIFPTPFLTRGQFCEAVCTFTAYRAPGEGAHGPRGFPMFWFGGSHTELYSAARDAVLDRMDAKFRAMKPAAFEALSRVLHSGRGGDGSPHPAEFHLTL